jgi:hypothetical protein
VRCWKALALASVLMLPGVSARADLAFTLTPVSQSGLGTNEVVFIANLTNGCQTNNLYLNDIRMCFTNAATNYLVADTNAFFANVPGILLTGEVYTGVVFGVPVSMAAPPGNYTGIVTFVGGTNIFATNTLASQDFQVSLPAAALAVEANGTNAILVWPSPPGDFVLQQNSNLATTNWTTVLRSLLFSNGLNQVTVPSTSSNLFYRLQYP